MKPYNTEMTLTDNMPEEEEEEDTSAFKWRRYIGKMN